MVKNSFRMDKPDSFEPATIINLTVSVPESQLNVPESEVREILKQMKLTSILFKSLYNMEIKKLLEDDEILSAEMVALERKIEDLTSEIKRKKRSRWCRVCELEATYMVHYGDGFAFFYCSEQCEQAHRKNHPIHHNKTQ